MYLRIMGDCFSDNIFREICGLTNHGVLHIDRVQYDEETRTISIPFERSKIESTKLVFLGTRVSYKYNHRVKIPGFIVIRSITECRIKDHYNPGLSEVHMLFGVIVRNKEKKILIGSAEEIQGRMCYSIELRVSQIDIEIRDDDTELAA